MTDDQFKIIIRWITSFWWFIRFFGGLTVGSLIRIIVLLEAKP